MRATARKIISPKLAKKIYDEIIRNLFHHNFNMEYINISKIDVFPYDFTSTVIMVELKSHGGRFTSTTVSNTHHFVDIDKITGIIEVGHDGLRNSSWPLLADILPAEFYEINSSEWTIDQYKSSRPDWAPIIGLLNQVFDPLRPHNRYEAESAEFQQRSKMAKYRAAYAALDIDIRNLSKLPKLDKFQMRQLSAMGYSLP